MKLLKSILTDEVFVANTCFIILALVEMMFAISGHPGVAGIVSVLVFVAATVLFVIDRGSMACFAAIVSMGWMLVFLLAWLVPSDYKAGAVIFGLIVAIFFQANLSVSRKNGSL